MQAAISPNWRYPIFPVCLFAPDKAIELFFEYPPATADFLSLDFTGGDILEISRAGYFEIKAGFLRVKNYILIAEVWDGIRPSLKTVATVRFFAAIFASATLNHMFLSHKNDLENQNTI